MVKLIVCVTVIDMPHPQLVSCQLQCPLIRFLLHILFSVCACVIICSFCRYMDVFPAFLKSASDGYSAGTCVTTKINRLLSCSGQHKGYLRLCPCRHYNKGQVALPVEL